MSTIPFAGNRFFSLAAALGCAALLAFAVTITGCDTADSDATADPALHAATPYSPPDAASAKGGEGYRIVWDGFDNGFATGSSAKWSYFAFGPYVGDDGIETTHPYGLRVVSAGTNAATGEPAFTRTLGQEGTADNPFFLPGDVDHVKWLVFMNHAASTGVPGFDAVEGQELRCEATMSGRTFGTAAHPFGGAVSNARDDTRLATVAMNAVDFETFMVFDFLLTNEHVYALYERLPFGRTEANNYASFTFQKPVARRTPSENHNLKVAYDRAAGTVRWLIDEKEVFRVDRIGRLIDRQYMLLDRGGDEEVVSPRQLNCGMGTFTLLDGHGPADTGLVRLTSQPNYNFSPPVGPPTLEVFLDDASLAENRLFGQGAELRMRQFVVSSWPSSR